MNKPIQIIYFLRFFATGTIVPVLTLMLLTRGATIETLSLIIGLYSVTVIAAEFPSGVFADLYGRRRAFLLSCVLYLASYCLFLFSRSAAALLIGMVANGLSRAFASGSVEALMIDDATLRQVPLERVTARLSILESAGLAAGALTGGLLADVGSRFSANLGVNIVTSAVLMGITVLFVREAPREQTHLSNMSHRQLFGKQVRDSLAFAKKRGTVRVLLVFSLLMGFGLSAVEIYWQPALASHQVVYWIFGAVSFAGFAFVMLGSWAAQRVISKHPDAGVALLLLLKAPLGIALVLFAFAGGAYSIIAIYLVLYLLIGSSSVVENTLLNRLTPASHRASILSLFSLVLQIGGVVTSLGGFFVSTYSRYQNMWLIAGVLMLSFSVLIGVLLNKIKRHDTLIAATPPSESGTSAVIPEPAQTP